MAFRYEELTSQLVFRKRTASPPAKPKLEGNPMQPIVLPTSAPKSAEARGSTDAKDWTKQGEADVAGGKSPEATRQEAAQESNALRAELARIKKQGATPDETREVPKRGRRDSQLPPPIGTLHVTAPPPKAKSAAEMKGFQAPAAPIPAPAPKSVPPPPTAVPPPARPVPGSEPIQMPPEPPAVPLLSLIHI